MQPEDWLAMKEAVQEHASLESHMNELAQTRKKPKQSEWKHEGGTADLHPWISSHCLHNLIWKQREKSSLALRAALNGHSHFFFLILNTSQMMGCMLLDRHQYFSWEVAFFPTFQLLPAYVLLGTCLAHVFRHTNVLLTLPTKGIARKKCEEFIFCYSLVTGSAHTNGKHLHSALLGGLNRYISRVHNHNFERSFGVLWILYVSSLRCFWTGRNLSKTNMRKADCMMGRSWVRYRLCIFLKSLDAGFTGKLLKAFFSVFNLYHSNITGMMQRKAYKFNSDVTPKHDLMLHKQI